MDRAGWSSGVLSAVKLNQSDSISGPWATSKPMEPKIASMRSRVNDTGCKPPCPRWRPGSVTSRASAWSCACSSASASAWRRSVSAASIACLATLIAAPVDFFSSTLSAAIPFISSVMRPDLPRNRALAFSKSAGVTACAKAALAVSTMAFNSVINSCATVCVIGNGGGPFQEKGLVLFQALALVSGAQNATKSVALRRELKQPVWLSLVPRCQQKQPCHGSRYRTEPCGRSRCLLSSDHWQTGCMSDRIDGPRR